jgi:hypothetical protein
MKKIIMTVAIFAFVTMFCRAGWCAGDPFKTHDKAFGINIDGVQLGMRFKNLDEIISFVFDKFEAPDPIFTEKLTIDAMMVDGTDVVGKLSTQIVRKDKTWTTPKNTRLLYGGSLFVSDATSLKDQAQRKDWTLRDYFSFGDKYPGWIVGLNGSYGDAYFVREKQGDSFYLVAFAFSDIKYPKSGYASRDVKDLALLFMEKYGVEDFAVPKYFYKNPSDGYALSIRSTNGGGSEISVIAIADADTVYPLCPVTGNRKIYYIDDKAEPGKKQIYPRDNVGSDAESALNINALSDWAFNGLSADLFISFRNEVTLE